MLPLDIDIVTRNKLHYILHLLLHYFRNRVAVQLQKNLDRVRLRRIAHKLSTAAAAKAVTNTSRTGGKI